MPQSKHLNFLLGSIIALLLVSGATYALAGWTAPSDNPPACDTDEGCNLPINVSVTGQTKLGALIAGGLRALTDLIVDGNVGIGTASPITKLDVRVDGSTPTWGSPGNYAANLYIQGINRNPVIGFTNHDSSATRAYYSMGVKGTGGLTIEQMGGAPGDLTAPINRLTITNGGNVGIGTANPLATLDVNGSVRIRGGAPDVNKVLTSIDTAGNTSWKTLAELGGGGGGGVNKIIAGTNITISPTTGLGDVTINATGGGNSNWLLSGTEISNTNSGNVGIGTITPGAKLSINASGPIIEAGSKASASGNSSIALGFESSATNVWSQAYGIQTISTGQRSTAIGVETTANGNYSTAAGTKIVVNGQGSYGIGLDSGAFPFPVVNNDRVMAIMGGNVGIGTTAPTATLDVAGSGNFTNDVTFKGAASAINVNKPASVNSIEVGVTDSNQYSYLDLKGDSTYTDYGLRLIRNNTGSNTNSALVHRGTGGLIMQVRDAGDFRILTSNLERLRVTADGKVGIGTTVPSATLDVNGSALVRNNLVSNTNTSLALLGGIVSVGNGLTTNSRLIVNGTVRITAGAGTGRVLTSDIDGNASWQESSGGEIKAGRQCSSDGAGWKTVTFNTPFTAVPIVTMTPSEGPGGDTNGMAEYHGTVVNSLTGFTAQLSGTVHASCFDWIAMPATQ